MNKLILICLLLILQGCATLGPMGTKEYLPMVAKASDINDKEIILSSRVFWSALNHENIEDSVDIIMHRKPITLYDSILVLSSDSLFILDWNPTNKEYTKRYKLDIDNIVLLKIRRFGLSRAIKINFKSENAGTYTFNLMTDSAQFQNTSISDELFDYLAKKTVPNGIEPGVF